MSFLDMRCFLHYITKDLYWVPRQGSPTSEHPKRQTLTLALTVYVKCLKYMKLVELDTKFTNEYDFVVNLPE
jgi:hypothetical protein